MNTPDTEWWKKVVDEDFCSFSPLTRDAINELIDKALTSRDTYWKERENAIKKEIAEHEVREEPVGGVIGWSNRVAEIEMFRRSLLQALDNLK